MEVIANQMVSRNPTYSTSHDKVNYVCLVTESEMEKITGEKFYNRTLDAGTVIRLNKVFEAVKTLRAASSTITGLRNKLSEIADKIEVPLEIANELLEISEKVKEQVAKDNPSEKPIPLIATNIR